MKGNTKVLFKYIGGKTWLKDKIRPEIEKILQANTDITTFKEPFAGGLGCFLNVYDILLKHNVKNVILNDINRKVINFYYTVATSPTALIAEYSTIEEAYIKLVPYDHISDNKIKDKGEIKSLLNEANLFYLAVRREFNQSTHDTARAAAIFLFLQTHCFNGVYRENKKGEYNTPFNWGLKRFDRIKSEEGIMAVHHVFSKFEVLFTNDNYKDVDFSHSQTLYYVDPPYINNKGEIQENKYHQDGFNDNDQKRLIDLLKDKCFIYSNHDHPLLITEFEQIHPSCFIQRVSRKNIMSASNESRKTDKMEILVSSE